MTTRKLLRFMILMLCVLAMSACAVQPVSDDAGSTGQSTGDTAQNTDIIFDWNAEILRVTLNDRSLGPDIQRLSYDSCKELVENALQKHGACDERICYFQEGESTEECRIAKMLKSISYSEKFFAENSLFLITFWNNNNAPFAVTDVTCEENVLTCTMDMYNLPPGGLSNGGGYYWSVFVEVDTVLPQGMQPKVETNSVILEKDEFIEKSNAFYKQYVE